MIQAKNITIRYGKEIPIRDFSFEINALEKITLTGPSGSGKSSILNAIPGFVPLDKGELYIDSVKLSPDSVQELRKKISWLPQELNLELETVENLLYYPFSFKENRRRTPDREKVSHLFRQLLLDDLLLQKSLSDISGGQKQRVALCSVILLENPVLLLDEPTSALDGGVTEQLGRVILSLEKTTVISASHDPLWISMMQREIKVDKILDK